MRKKSHISLARYIVEDMKMPELQAHRKAFYLGSILPDCKLSFLTRRHEFGETFDIVTGQIEELTRKDVWESQNPRVYMRHLGEVVHYIADYFTFPHNRNYEGNFKDHCYYEKALKFRLREYVRSGEAFQEQTELKHFAAPEAIVSFIRSVHQEYLSRKRNVEEDCRYIVRVCRQVVQGILSLISSSAEVGLAAA